MFIDCYTVCTVDASHVLLQKVNQLDIDVMHNKMNSKSIRSVFNLNAQKAKSAIFDMIHYVYSPCIQWNKCYIVGIVTSIFDHYIS